LSAIALWIRAVLVAALVTLAGLMTVLKAPMSSALSFLFALPVVLMGLKSFRTSAISMVALLLWTGSYSIHEHKDVPGAGQRTTETYGLPFS
jgi:hypothetical protein